MPIIPPTMLASWYRIVDATTGDEYLFESYRERPTMDVQRKKVLSGDIGEHVKSIGGVKTEYQINSPALIVDGYSFATIIGLVQNGFNALRSPDIDLDLPWILKAATINFSEAGTTCDITIWQASPSGGAFNAVFGTPPDYYGRVARFYDTVFQLTLPTGSNVYPIKSGAIRIEVEISEEFFVGQGSQLPNFAIQGYSISGSVVVVGPPNDGVLVIPLQEGGTFYAPSASLNLVVQGTGDSLALGDIAITSQIEKAFVPGQPVTFSLQFQTYARFGSGDI